MPRPGYKVLLHYKTSRRYQILQHVLAHTPTARASFAAFPASNSPSSASTGTPAINSSPASAAAETRDSTTTRSKRPRIASVSSSRRVGPGATGVHDTFLQPFPAQNGRWRMRYRHHHIRPAHSLFRGRQRDRPNLQRKFLRVIRIPAPDAHFMEVLHQTQRLPVRSRLHPAAQNRQHPGILRRQQIRRDCRSCGRAHLRNQTSPSRIASSSPFFEENSAINGVSQRPV